MSAETPQEEKRLSNELNRKINMNVWMDTLANKVMLDGVTAKFSQNPHLKEFLMKTGKKVFVEDNPRYAYWSSDLATKDVRKLVDRENWPGKKHFGQNTDGSKGGFITKTKTKETESKMY